MKPWPLASVCMKSKRSRAGSPKSLCPPCSSRLSSARWMAPTRGRRDVAVRGADLAGVVGDELEDRAQVVHVEQQQAVVVGHAEGDGEHRLLDLVEVEHAAEQERADLGDGRAHGVPLLAEHVPEHDRRALESPRGDAELLDAVVDLVVAAAGLRDAREVALDVGSEDRHADAAEGLGEDLQRDRLARAGCAGDEPVAVGHVRQQVDLCAARRGRTFRDEQAVECVSHGRSFPRVRPCPG